ncbi:Unknown protein sequence [Pseudomonas amygdali pv. sesami]|nr:Unknown protein sequence [Pseudomonas amygdali pv. sesami]
MLSEEQVQWLSPATGTDLLHQPIASRKTMSPRTQRNNQAQH